jgi:Do/DeqQ family serine protease
MLEKAMPAVVNISSAQTQISNNPLLNDPIFRHFFNIPAQKTHSRGSGVVIDARKGYVVTNHHVIEKANEITVNLQDGREFKAEIIGTDPETDVALMKIPAENLTTLPSANSDQLRVGDFVVAIGNPFGLGQTVTSGIVSALGRSGLGIEGYEDFIQTDASINPGNSGGALVNLRGELIGINTAIFAPSGGNVGIGFAIPSNMVQQVVQHLVQFGEVQRGSLGIRIQELTPQLASALGLENSHKGAVVTEIAVDSPAEKAGLQPADVIVAINNQPVNRVSEVRNRVGLLRIGEKVALTVLRRVEFSI